SFDGATVGAWFQDSAMRRSNWHAATFSGALFTRVALDGAKFDGSLTEYAVFKECAGTLDAIASLDLGGASVGVDSFWVPEERQLPNKEAIVRDVALAKRIVDKAVATRNLDLADRFYFLQRRLALEQTTSVFRRTVDRLWGCISGWGTRLDWVFEWIGWATLC